MLPAIAVFAITAGVGQAATEPPEGASLRPAAPTRAQAERATRLFLRSNPAKANSSGGSGTGGGGGSGRLFPSHRMVALYGSPAMPATILGRIGVKRAKRKARQEARRYNSQKTPSIPAFDLVAVLATSSPGPDHKYRMRAPNREIKRYVDAARTMGGRVLLDIQPARSTFLREIRALRRWVRKPNVDVALDAEWNLGRHGVPGRDQGSVSARYLNRVSRRLQGIVRSHHLPPKALVIHQFQRRSIHRRRAVRQRHRVDVTLDFDGIGRPREKKAGYERYSDRDLFNGIMLFYRLDTHLMSPRRVLDLRPKPNFVAYQ